MSVNGWIGVISAAVAMAGMTAATAQTGAGPSGSTLYQPPQTNRPVPSAPSAPPAATPAATPAAAPATAPGRPRPDAKAQPARGTGRGPAVALDGRYEDTDCVPLVAAGSPSPLFVRRSYAFDDRRKRWELKADVFNHDRCRPQSRLLTYQGGGTFSVTGVSRLGSNVYETSFNMESWSVTPQSREGTLALFNARCGSGVFDEGREIDVSRTGCPLLAVRPLAQAPTGSDLLRVADGKLFLGQRSSDPVYADERPTQLSAYGLTRL